MSYKPDRKRPRGKKAGEVAADGSARGEGEADEANGDNADASGQSTPASSNRIMSEPWTGGDLPLTDPVTFGLGLSNSQEELGDGEDLEGDLDDMDDSIANEEEDGNRGETEEPSGQLSIPLPRDEPTSSIGDMDLA